MAPGDDRGPRRIEGLLGNAVELSVDRTRGDAEQLGGQGLVALGVPERLANDPELDLVYWGTGNAEPYNPVYRGGQDSLYTASVIAHVGANFGPIM